ncbi:hypothetical protein MLD38_032384 [Melastoma candidum]|uniref:Uncharacterized protein n=1 Tax=Melastoma candidum TaxID=119954 RepID=A0ACB9M5Q1_9MYRT|nr:hypothetical protein MLD38_032384 [Melastoma candidum]
MGRLSQIGCSRPFHAAHLFPFSRPPAAKSKPTMDIIRSSPAFPSSPATINRNNANASPPPLPIHNRHSFSLHNRPNDHLQLTPTPKSPSCLPSTDPHKPRCDDSTVLGVDVPPDEDADADDGGVVTHGGGGRGPSWWSDFVKGKLVRLFISIAVGIVVRFIIPRPEEVSHQAWQLLAIFLSTIMGLILEPLPVGAWAFLGLTVAVVSRTLTFQAAFSAFTSEVLWLIVISFFFARGFVKTGLGDRIATYFVKWLGRNTLGLSYGLTLSEALIAPAMPSTTARAGGVFVPIIKSLSLAAGSQPRDPSAKKMGSYLIMSQFQSAGNSSALFLTAAAQNMLCIKLAEELGVVIPNPWVTWLKAACFPAIISLLATPVVLYKLYPPLTRDTPEAPALAAERLKNMGPVTKNEWVMIATMLLAVSLWISGDKLGIPSVVAAMIGLSTLLLLGVLDWDDCVNEKSAWDTLIWFAILVGMAGQLTNLGIVKWMSDHVAKALHSWSLSWPASFAILQAAYFFVHYLFASQTGHVGALYSAFLAMHIAAGVPRVLSALVLSYTTNLFGAITHYSSGQAAVYYGAGYVDLRDVFKIGITMAFINGAIWGVVGAAWWKILGLY